MKWDRVANSSDGNWVSQLTVKVNWPCYNWTKKMLSVCHSVVLSAVFLKKLQMDSCKILVRDCSRHQEKPSRFWRWSPTTNNATRRYANHQTLSTAEDGTAPLLVISHYNKQLCSSCPLWLYETVPSPDTRQHNITTDVYKNNCNTSCN